MGQNITEDRIIHPYKKEDINNCKDKKQVASVFNQMLLVLGVMKEDLEHRKKYLMVKSCKLKKVLINDRLRVSKVS